MNTDTDERVREIQGRFGTSAATWEDVGYLLSLLDSQAAVYPPATNTGRGRCRHNVPTCGECQIGEVLAHVAEKEKVANDAATRMRDLCVAKVRELVQGWAKPKTAATAYKFDAGNEIITALESLTLEQGEREK